MSVCQPHSNFHAACLSNLSLFVFRPYFNPCVGDVPEAPLRSHEEGHGTQRPLRLPDRPHYLQLQQQARPVFVTRYRLHPSPIHRGMQNNRFVVIFFSLRFLFSISTTQSSLDPNSIGWKLHQERGNHKGTGCC